MSYQNITDESIEKQLLSSIDKVPFEMKKVKFYLWILKKVNFLKKLFK